MLIFLGASLVAPQLLSQGSGPPASGQQTTESPGSVVPQIVGDDTADPLLAEEEAEAPNGAGSIPEEYRGKVVRNRMRAFRPKMLALTFDDGPDPKVTPRVLAALKKYEAKATFFVLGKSASKHPEILREIAAAGHATGNHTYDHPRTPSASEAVSQLDRTSEAIEQATGSRTALFRPPYGIVKGENTAEAIRQGFAAILWTISSADTRKVGPKTIARNVTQTPNPGDIVIMHDGPGHADTVVALEAVLEELSAKRWTFVTVPELLHAWEAERKAKLSGQGQEE